MHENELFAGDGEVRALARRIDWAATPLGPVESWSETLRTSIRTCLDSPFPMNLWCGDELVLIYNDGYRHVLGTKHPAALGRRGSEVWSEIWTSISPLFDRIRRGGPAAFAEDAPFGVHRDTDVDAGSGEPNAWFTYSLSPIRDPGGRLVAFLNIVSESTPRVLAEREREAALAAAERAEARLREVFTHAPAFLAVLRGRDHVFEYVNSAYYQLVGHRDLLGRSVWDALPEVRGQGFEQLLDGVLETGKPFIGREVPVLVSRTPESPPERRFVDVVYYPITGDDGEPSGVVAHGSDVTDHVLARREAHRARADAERANQAKSHFLANMSHEIRTPINAVIGYTDLLDAGVAGELTDRQHEYVARVRASSKHLLGLVNDVLDLAKIEAGEMTVQLDVTPASQPLDEALEMVSPQAESRGLELTKAWDCPGPGLVRGDTDRIRQILLNLLSNALKFTEPGGSIVARCRHADAPEEGSSLPPGGPWIVLEVEDTGTGIPEEQLTQIFEPFVQAEAGHTRTAPGTGLGLTISRRLARLMGGELTARSTPGVGSSFAVWLPAHDQVLEQVGAPGWSSVPAEQVDPADLGGLGDVADVLIGSADLLEAEMVDRLRADRTIPAASGLTRVQLADHTSPLLSIMAKALIALEQVGGGALLSDGQYFQEVLSVGHGRQRRRLGWRRQDLDREFEILHEVIDGFLRAEAPKRTAAELGGAIDLVHRLLERARAASLAGYDQAGS